MNIARALIAAPLILVFGIASAQTDRASGAEKKKIAEVEVKADALAKALEKLKDQDEWVMTGSVKEEEASGSGDGITRMIVVGGGSGGGPAFTGAFEAWRTEADELVIVSKESLPGVAYYDNGDRGITQVSYEEQSLNPSTLTNDLFGLLDLERLTRAVKKADLELARNQEEKTDTYRCEIPRRLVRRSSGSPLQFMAPQVLKVTAEFVVKDTGRLEQIRFNVVRSDPFASMKRKALEGEFDEGVSITTEMPDLSEEEGKVTEYSLRPTREGPSDRTKKFLEQIHAILEKEVF